MIHRLFFVFNLLIVLMATSHAFTSTSRRVLKGVSPVQRSDNIMLAKAKKADEEVVNFRKAEFVASIAEKTGMTKADSEKALSAVLNVIATEVSSGKRISLPGFGTFKLSFRAARKGRNPKTGEEMDIRASYTPSFSASKSFKDMANPDR